MRLNTVQTRPGGEAREAKTCHFRGPEHDITTPRSSRASNWIYSNVFKLWLAMKHKKSLPPSHSQPPHTFCGGCECHLNLRHIRLNRAEYQESESSALKCCFHLVLFLLWFCFFPESGIPEQGSSSQSLRYVIKGPWCRPVIHVTCDWNQNQSESTHYFPYFAF